MEHLIHVFSSPLRDPDRGTVHIAEAWGTRRGDGHWEGWLRFISTDGDVLKTDRETTQSNLEALTYWATGLEPVYLEGALRRVMPRNDGRNA